MTPRPNGRLSSFRAERGSSTGKRARESDLLSAEHDPPIILKASPQEVIIIAYCCAPSEGSEAGAGWSWAKAASEVAHVTLLTYSPEWRSEIEQAIAEQDLAITVHWVNTPDWLPPSLFQSKIALMAHYCAWQALAAKVVRELEGRMSVDVAHHVTFASDSLPSALLASRAPIRVWGPVGGSGRSTLGLYRYLTPRGVLSEVLRGGAQKLLHATTGRSVAQHATLIAALNNDVRDHWRRVPTPVVVQSNTALAHAEIGEARVTDHSADFSRQRTALFVGRLIPWKGLRLAIESLCYAPDWRLVILGEGPDKNPSKQLAAKLGVANRIEFRGQVPRSEVLKAMQIADGLLFTSFHDSAPWAVGEATAQGCPVICLDVGGPWLQAGRNAHVVPMVPHGSLPRRMGETLQNLAADGVPDDHLLADRLPALLQSWYSGNIAASRGSVLPVVPAEDTSISGPRQ